jgi:hypothetical protein
VPFVGLIATPFDSKTAVSEIGIFHVADGVSYFSGVGAVLSIEHATMQSSPIESDRRIAVGFVCNDLLPVRVPF